LHCRGRQRSWRQGLPQLPAQRRRHVIDDARLLLAPGRHLGFSINRLEDELAPLFGQPVDLVSKAALHRVIRDDVLAEAQSLYAA